MWSEEAGQVKWSSEATELAERVDGKIPLFVRRMVTGIIRPQAEALAAGNGSDAVGVEHLREAYLLRTPRTMQSALRKVLDGSAEADSVTFPTGQLMTEEEIEAFLAEEGVGRLGTVSADGTPYVVPLSFVYEDGCIYYHWFRDDGRKAENIAATTRVCFEVDWCTKDQLSYKSVIADGTVEEVTELCEKSLILGLLEEKFPAYASGSGHSKAVRGVFDAGREAMVKAVRVFRIRVEQVTGKKKAVSSRSI